MLLHPPASCDHLKSVAPPCTFSTLKFHFFANLFNWSFRFFYYIKGVFWPAPSFLVDLKKFFANQQPGWAPEMVTFFLFFVLGRVRKCVELFSPNWRGQTLSSPIRFSSADRRTKSRVKGMDELTKWSHLFTFCVRASGKVCRVILLKLAGSDFELSHTIFKCWQTHEIHDLQWHIMRKTRLARWKWQFIVCKLRFL